jgi:6,7-dimethyl-8-ribityllumazine synthase
MKNIHIVVSVFNNPIPEKLLAGAVQALKDHQFPEKNIVITKVPGAFELPLLALATGQQNDTAAVICLGAVIRGETSHYDYVCSETARGIMDVGLKLMKPVIFGVLTTDNEAQAEARAKPDKTNKGYECAVAALTMIKALQAHR